MRRDIPFARATRVARRKLGLAAATRYGDLLIPPPELRQGGQHFQDDAAFVKRGGADALRLRDAFGLTVDTRIVDVGSGAGRLAIGLLDQIGEMRAYTGVDVSERSVSWCLRNITAHHPGMRFIHLDAANERYQPQGRPIDASYQLPLDDGSVDIVYLYSVFSHMASGDVRVYLGEFRRVLAPGGGVLLTAFIEEDVDDVAINPPGYGPLAWQGALHCVRFSRKYFFSMVDAAGLRVEHIEHGTETDGQSALYLRPASP